MSQPEINPPPPPFTEQLPPAPITAPMPLPPLPVETLSYAAPAMQHAGIWREGQKIVTVTDTDLGDYCVKCAECANGWRLRRRMYWHTPWLYCLILIPVMGIGGLLVYFIVALCIRQTTLIWLPLCPRHRSRHRLLQVIAGVVAFVAFAALAVGFALAVGRHTESEGLLTLLGGFLLLIVAGCISIGNRPLRPTRIAGGYAWLAGAGDPFLQGLSLLR